MWFCSFVLSPFGFGYCTLHRRRGRRCGQFGFSIVELLTVIAIASVTLAFAASPLRQLSLNWQLKAATNSLFFSLQLARSEAIKRNERVVLCKSVNGNACNTSGGWQQGWIVFVDSNNNTKVDAGETIVLYQQQFQPNVLITGNLPLSNYISYKGSGATAQMSGAFQAGTITACNASRSQVEARKIIVNSVGKARQIKETIPSC